MMNNRRTAPAHPDALPAIWWCVDCAATLPRAAFPVLRERRDVDGSWRYRLGRYCRLHWRARARPRERGSWEARQTPDYRARVQARRDLAAQRRAEREARHARSEARHAAVAARRALHAQKAMEREVDAEQRRQDAERAAAFAAERQRRKRARAAAVCRYVAGLWDQTPAWLLAPQRSPEQVEARALVAVILYDEHHFGLSETARVIGRDHSTALHLLKRYGNRPELQDLLADYRHWRAQRRAARTTARKAG